MPGLAGSASESAAESDWAERPWSRTFDLIQDSYGWTTEHILDLPLKQIRHWRDVILTRRDEDWRARVGLEEKILQTTVSAIHAAAGNKAGMRQASRIRLLPKKKPTQLSSPMPTPQWGSEEIAAERKRLEESGQLDSQKAAYAAMMAERGE